jgi:hypothetical protein
MTKLIKLGFGTAAFVLLSSTVSAQQTATATVTATANVAAKARLDVTGAVAFADADPDVTTQLTAAALNIAVKARTGNGQPVLLTVVAGGNFVEPGGASIGIANLDWIVSGTGFVAGTAALTDVTLGSWSGSGNRTGTQTYRLVNSWAYDTGSYSVTLTYTLTAP